MKKKVLATLLAGALVATSVAGFSACSDGGIPKGDEVTEEEWRESFENMSAQDVYYGYSLNFTDFTFEGVANIEATVDGTVMQSGWSIDPDTGAVNIGNPEEVSLKATTKWSESKTVLFKDDEYYYDSLSSTEIDETRKDENIDWSYKNIETRYCELRDGNDENNNFWIASYYKTESSELEGAHGFDHDWSAYAASSDNRSPIYELGQYAYGWFVGPWYYESKETTNRKSLSDMYNSFTYSKGRYTATLYKRTGLYGRYEEYYDYVECTVTLSFDKTEKCVIGFGIQSEEEGTISQEGSYNLNYAYKEDSSFVISKINSTNVSKKKNAEITKAIDKAKEEMNNN